MILIMRRWISLSFRISCVPRMRSAREIGRARVQIWPNYLKIVFAVFIVHAFWRLRHYNKGQLLFVLHFDRRGGLNQRTFSGLTSGKNIDIKDQTTQQQTFSAAKYVRTLSWLWFRCSFPYDFQSCCFRLRKWWKPVWTKEKNQRMDKSTTAQINRQ